MAATAIGTKLTVVNIVGAMAVSATAAWLPDFLERAAMAVVARDALVRAGQGKVGLSCVIKQP